MLALARVSVRASEATVADRGSLYGVLARLQGVRQLFALEGKRVEGILFWLDRRDPTG